MTALDGSTHEHRSADDELEAIIDRRGLANVAESIASIAREKAEHIRTNWQDASLAASWDQAARAFDRTAANIAVRGVSR